MAVNIQEILARVEKASLANKLVVVVALVAAITAGAYFLSVSPDLDAINAKSAELGRLERDLIDKQAIANNLAQFKREKEILERRLQQALTELPNESNIDDLIRALSEIGQKSGLTIDVIDPHPETTKGFYAAIPIDMKVHGNYHEIGVFFDSLSKLPRIVNVSNISLGGGKAQADKVTLAASFVAVTFRFVDSGKAAKK